MAEMGWGDTAEGFVEEPRGKVYRAVLYNDRTNEGVIDFCKNVEIKSIESFEEMLPFIFCDGCSRMMVNIDSYWDSTRIYYRISNHWTRIDQETAHLDLETEYHKDFNEQEEISLTDENSLSDIEAIVAFWKNRRAIRLALIELDPLCISRYPLLQT